MSLTGTVVFGGGADVDAGAAFADPLPQPAEAGSISTEVHEAVMVVVLGGEAI